MTALTIADILLKLAGFILDRKDKKQALKNQTKKEQSNYETKTHADITAAITDIRHRLQNEQKP